MAGDGASSVPSRRCSATLVAARLITPLHQGELGGLCGIYSAINAIRLLAATQRPLPFSESNALFRHGIRFLERRDKLSACARHGSGTRCWRHLTQHLFGISARWLGVEPQLHRPLRKVTRPTMAIVASEIEAALSRGSPVLVSLTGFYDHYTIIVGHSERRWHLFDSYGYRWVAKSSCGLDTDGSVARHQIDPRAILVASVAGD